MWLDGEFACDFGEGKRSSRKVFSVPGSDSVSDSDSDSGDSRRPSRSSSFKIKSLSSLCSLISNRLDWTFGLDALFDYMSFSDFAINSINVCSLKGFDGMEWNWNGKKVLHVTSLSCKGNRIDVSPFLNCSYKCTVLA